MKLFKKTALAGLVAVGSLILAAPAAFGQTAQNTSSVVAPGNGSQAAGCLSPTDSCNTDVTGVTQKNTANQLNGNNPTATSTSAGGGGGTGGSGKAVANPTADATVIQNNPAPNQLQVGVRVGGTASTPTTLGQGGFIEVRKADGAILRIQAGVNSNARNFLGIAAWGSSKQQLVPGTEGLLQIETAKEVSELTPGQFLNSLRGFSEKDQKELILNAVAESGNNALLEQFEGIKDIDQIKKLFRAQFAARANAKKAQVENAASQSAGVAKRQVVRSLLTQKLGRLYNQLFAFQQARNVTGAESTLQQIQQLQRQLSL